ncbi:hotdog family protein [Halococcoides cellulosivorans]|uniref:Acyl dehydratase n=1 Tax=Halococcoides cellulosivorans TaxID=1679096 RepID=A0A2R4X1S4_9EURY|nr:acyl dehydratase [Halococcoides cellulosivorans]AWB27735.1 acyl dehydratase [Halococcoides cellulosivorans]
MPCESGRNTALESWAATSAQVVDSVMAANRAAFVAMGVDQSERRADDPDRSEWSIDRSVESAPLSVGDRVTVSKPLERRDLERYAISTGDRTPIEATEIDGERLIQGPMLDGIAGAALSRLPGQTVPLSMDLAYQAPVPIGERIAADCEIVEDLGADQFRLSVTVHGDGSVYADGESVVLME